MVGSIRKHGPIMAFVALTLTDLFMTLPLWHYEANPIVIAIGPIALSIVKITLSVIAVAVWYSFRLHRSTIGLGVVSCYASLMAVVVLWNTACILVNTGIVA